MNRLLLTHDNSKHDQEINIIDSVRTTVVNTLNQRKQKDPESSDELITLIKETIQSALRIPNKHYHIKEKIIDSLNDILNDKAGKNSEEFEKLLQDQEEIIYLKTCNYKKNIINWEIENSDDIIRLIKQENIIVNMIKKIINKKNNKGESILKEIFKPIEQDFLETNNSNDPYNQIISHEIKKELEYISIKKLINLNKQVISKKRTWCKNALYYIQNEFLYGQTKEPIKLFEESWEKYYGPIIDDFLQEKSSFHKKNKININQEKTKNLDPDILPSQHLKLFEKRCKAVIYEKPREEYKLGKDILRELGEWEIPLE